MNLYTVGQSAWKMIPRFFNTDRDDAFGFILGGGAVVAS